MPNSEVSRSEYCRLENDVSNLKYSLDKAIKEIAELNAQISTLMDAIQSLREGSNYDE